MERPGSSRRDPDRGAECARADLEHGIELRALTLGLLSFRRELLESLDEDLRALVVRETLEELIRRSRDGCVSLNSFRQGQLLGNGAREPQVDHARGP